MKHILMDYPDSGTVYTCFVCGMRWKGLAAIWSHARLHCASVEKLNVAWFVHPWESHCCSGLDSDLGTCPVCGLQFKMPGRRWGAAFVVHCCENDPETHRIALALLGLLDSMPDRAQHIVIGQEECT